ncbi:MAG: hypothetical protein Kow0063_07530 [Anaerolineae bacterium]
MIHPDTRLKWINPHIGYGVFATAFIPMGTMVYVEDPLDIVIGPDSPLLHDPAYRHLISKYACIDTQGNRVISWDIAKYVNHCCHYNCLSTGYGFEIAVRNIQAGEELTDDYGVFNLEDELKLTCRYEDCRKVVRATDFDTYAGEWDAVLRRALQEFQKVPQPLLKYLNAQTYDELMGYLTSGHGYKSIQALRYVKHARQG